MVVLTAKYFCKPGKGDEVEAYLKEMQPLVHQYEKLFISLIVQQKIKIFS
ncbi:hypothetical protein [Bacillus sp. MUM 116]|nr:hypothetical protein [Bacillus sp. MUM 116]